MAARLDQQLTGGAVVDDLEMRRDAGLDREAPQELAAQAVDGHHREAARQVEHAGEEPPRRRHQRLAGLAGERLQLLGQRGVVLGDGPAGQSPLDAQRHLGGGGLGEGDAEDALGMGIGQQQAQHPVGQHPGLAGAGIGGDPDGDRGIGGAALLGRGRLRHHGAVSVPRHSSMRDRWS